MVSINSGLKLYSLFKNNCFRSLQTATETNLPNYVLRLPPVQNSEILFLPKAITSDVVQLSEATLPISQKGLGFKEILKNYNIQKIASAQRHGRTTEILNNWQGAYGIANKQGVFENAINKLKGEGGAIDTYLSTAFPNLNPTTRNEARQILIKYLENNLDIYSYPRLRSILRDFSQQIKKSGENTVIYIPDETKSYGIIGSLFKEINPESKVVTGWKNLQEYSVKNPNVNVAILDDCLVSGESAVKLYDSIATSCPNVQNIDMYICAAYQKGISRVAQEAPKLNLHYSGTPKLTLEETDFFKNLIIMAGGKPKTVQQDFLKTLLRCQDTSQGYAAGTAIMFPYMAPNNNSLFSANMIQHLFSGPQFAIKNIEKNIISKEGRLEYPPKWLVNILG